MGKGGIEERVVSYRCRMSGAEFGEEGEISMAPMFVVRPTGGELNHGGFCAEVAEGGRVAIGSHQGGGEAMGKGGAVEFRFDVVIVEGERNVWNVFHDVVEVNIVHRKILVINGLEK